MIAASASHRLLNFVQSALLLGLMAAIAWIAVTAKSDPRPVSSWRPRCHAGAPLGLPGAAAHRS